MAAVRGKNCGGRRPGAGRPKGSKSRVKLPAWTLEEMRTHAQSLVPRMFQVLDQIAHDEKAPAAARVSAASVICDRAHGKAPQHLEHTGKGGAPLFAFFSALEAEDEAEAQQRLQ